MRRFNRFLLIITLFSSTVLKASDASPFFVFGDFLYWKANEEIDWNYDNNLNSVNQELTYHKAEFDPEPGFRLGFGYGNSWDTGFYYTHYTASTHDSSTGNLKSSFLGGTIGLPIGHPFYNAGQFKMDIDYNIFDWYFGKKFNLSHGLMLHPLIGLEGGWIDQSIRADFQGYYNTTEKLENNFWGVGPKFGVDGSLNLWDKDHSSFNFIASIATAYLLGHWDISDIYTDNSPRTIEIGVKNKNMGALTFQGMLGFAFHHKDITVALSYEINDWFDQGQIFDDATGGHENDLILQGLVFRLQYTNI